MFKLIMATIILPFFIIGCGEKKNQVVQTLKIGHVGHDHHLPLFIALDMASENPEVFCSNGIIIKNIIDKKRYELHRDGINIMNLEILKVGGGSKMPTALAQNVIDIGYGGIAPVLAAIDKGSPIKIISPLHSKGDMFVLTPDFPANNWKQFIDIVKKSNKIIKIGYKSPLAVAKIILENALTYEKISFSSNITNTNVKIQLINVKGGGKLNPSISNGIIDGYVGNNPFPAIGENKKILKVICELEKLPPENFKNHPCCCIAGGPKSLENKSNVIKILMSINQKAIEIINSDLNKSAQIANRWIGSTEEVEKKSIVTSGYSMVPTQDWHNTMDIWNIAMNKLGFFDKKLKNLTEEELGKKAYDFQYLEPKQKR